MTKTNLRVFKLLASVSALLASWSCSAVAAEIIPPDRRTDWTPGVTVGVPGGIPTDRDRRIDVTKAPYHADNTGVADSQPAIQKAIADAQENDVVYLPAGTYRIDKTVAVAGGKSRITIRGAGPDKTVIMAYQQSHLAISPADGGDWWYPNRLKLEITGSPKKGHTVLTVGDTRLWMPTQTEASARSVNSR